MPYGEVHLHCFGSVDRDISNWCLLLELADGGIKLDKVSIGNLHADSSGGVISVFLALTSVFYRII